MIRLANENDLDSILEIFNEAILNTTSIYTYKPQTYEDRKAWFDKKMEEGFPVFVFEMDDRVVGFAAYGPFRPFPAYKYTIEHSVYVHKDYRGKGIGEKLLIQLINSANTRGYATMIAGIDSLNEKSISLHKKLGFVYSGTINKAGFKFSKWLDLVFYQLDLNGPTEPLDG